MQAILDICCGLDVHKEDVEKEIKVFKTFLNDLTALKAWIESHDCHHVAMESTGVYWCPVYDVLEAAFNGNIEILVTNARHMRNVPGKKTDIKDSEVKEVFDNK